MKKKRTLSEQIKPLRDDKRLKEMLKDYLMYGVRNKQSTCPEDRFIKFNRYEDAKRLADKIKSDVWAAVEDEFGFNTLHIVEN